MGDNFQIDSSPTRFFYIFYFSFISIIIETLIVMIQFIQRAIAAWYQFDRDSFKYIQMDYSARELLFRHHRVFGRLRELNLGWFDSINFSAKRRRCDGKQFNRCLIQHVDWNESDQKSRKIWFSRPELDSMPCGFDRIYRINQRFNLFHL